MISPAVLKPRSDVFLLDVQTDCRFSFSVRSQKNEMRSGTHLLRPDRVSSREILRCHLWGCPVYVLEAKLQNDQKLPKLNRRARLGQFVGFLDKHSSMVANV